MARDWQTNRANAISNYASLVGGGAPISSAGTVPYGDYANKINQFTTKAAQDPYIANLPGYLANITQRSANTSAQLQGKLPQDVLNLLAQQGAERGIATGSPGSPNTNTAYLSALGLTSLGQQKEGAANLSQSISDTPVPQLFNPASIAVPEHMAGMELRAALLGGGGGQARLPGSPSIVASSGPGRAPGMDPWGSQAQGFGGTHAMVTGNQFGPSPGQQTGSMYVNGQLMTNDAIAKIANGNLGGGHPYYPPIPEDQPNRPYDVPEGSWYNPNDDTYSPSWTDEDYSSYFD